MHLLLLVMLLRMMNNHEHIHMEVNMRIKFYNIATSTKAIQHAESMLKLNPNMWPGAVAGYKGLITAHKNAIIAYEGKK